MSTSDSVSRRRFLAASGAALSLSTSLDPLMRAAEGDVPVGLELYSVRGEFEKDDMATVRAVAEIGYQIVEFWAPYFDWTTAHAREMRTLMDDAGIQCRSTHNHLDFFDPDRLSKTIELNQALGATYLVIADVGCATPPRTACPVGVDGWRRTADQLNEIATALKPHGMKTGYHNHNFEWGQIEGAGGQRRMDILRDHTGQDVALQLDVGTALQAGADLLAWINSCPGRIKSVHCKDWGAGDGPERGGRVLFGEGDSPWRDIFAAAESVGGVEYYLIEQEGSRYSELETARRCLATYRQMRS